MFILLLQTASAWIVTSNCGPGDAPAPFDQEDHQVNGTNACQGLGTTMFICSLEYKGCDLTPASTSLMFAVNYTQEPGSFTVWGGCQVNGVEENFCLFVEDPIADLRDVVLIGTDGDDEPISFHYGAGVDERWFEPTHNGDFAAHAYGREGDDYVSGGNHEGFTYIERLHGDGGDDEIRGLDGIDWLYGGPDNDELIGGSGWDVLLGQRGNDTLFGDNGNDVLHGGPGSDHLEGGNHHDTLYGSTGTDVLDGENGHDFLCETTIPASGTCPNDTLHGRSGFDRASVAVHPSCPVSLNGLPTIEQARDPSIPWTSFGIMNSNPGILPATPYYSQCLYAVAIGGL